MDIDNVLDQLSGANLLSLALERSNAQSVKMHAMANRFRADYRKNILTAISDKGGSVNIDAIGSQIADDAIYISDMGVIKGKKAIMEQYAKTLSGLKVKTLSLQPTDVQHHGGIIIDEGIATQVVDSNGKLESKDVYYNIVWKQVGNELKISRLTSGCVG